MNMFKPTKAKTVKGYIDALPNGRKEMVEFLDKFIQNAVPKLKPYFASNMIGYGKFKYKNYKKETIDWPIIALASQKQYVSVFVCSIVDGKYVAETHKDKLGKVKVGKSCISIKRFEDINLPELSRVLKIAEMHPGLSK